MSTGPGGASGRRIALVLARALLVTVAIFVIYYSVPLRSTIDLGTLLRLLAGLAALTVLLAWQIRAIVTSPHPTLRAAETIAVAVPVFIVLFSATYTVMSAAQQAAFTQPLSRTDAVYFTVTIFATVGFGDIAAVSTPARIVVTIQMVADLILLGVVLRAILSAVERGRARQAETTRQ